MDDTERMLRIKEGDEQAFRQIVESYWKPILNLCFHYVGNQEDAEEVAQDVFIRLHKAAESYEPRAKLSTFLYRIAVNLSLNRIRDRKRKRLISLDDLLKNRAKHSMISEADDPDSLLGQKEKQQAIQKAVAALPSSQRTAVLLKRFQGLSYEEIAEVMNCSVSAVEARLHRAKQNLMKKLKHLVE